RDAERRVAALVGRVEPEDRPMPVRLLDLVAVDRIVEEEGEVREEIQLVVLPVAMDADRLLAGDVPAELGVAAESLGVAALAVVNSPEAVDQPRPHRAGRDLARREPVAVEI